MTIAFDFDDTITLDPDFWAHVIRSVLDHGHVAIICTCRGDHRRPTAESWAEERFGDALPVVRAYANPKWSAAAEAGFEVDIWVDDDPYSVVRGAYDPEPI